MILWNYIFYFKTVIIGGPVAINTSEDFFLTKFLRQLCTLNIYTRATIV